ncbi:membrane protein [Christiangramia forsetii KT0803]|uniref:Membrane protein n=2 Tax=Christiangramia forsetii TaxID=411153 RepID=A0LZA5_CHRFK|nr:membrane protein [Christiangramia forsetii KT0803]
MRVKFQQKLSSYPVFNLEIMENNIYKSLGILAAVIISRSLYMHQEFYANIWFENQLKIIFLGLIFLALIVMVIRFQNFEKVKDK